jgi:hypothetical protein
LKAGGTRTKVIGNVLLAFGFIMHAGWYLAATIFFIQNKIINDLDFLSSYTASEIAKSAGYPWIYDTQRQAEIQAIIRGPDFFESGLLPFIHPPFIVPLYTILLPTDYSAAYVIWQVFAILVVVGTGFVLAGLLLAGGLPARSALPMALCAAVFYPTLVSAWKGQDTVILLGAVGLWALGLTRKDERLAGLALALATIRPQIALGLAIPMLFARRKVFGWFVVGALVLGVYSLLLIGFEGALDYKQILQMSAAGEIFNINQQDMFNLLGLSLRIFPGFNPGWLGAASWALFFGVIGLVSYLWWKSDGRQKPAWYLIFLSIVLVNFASPHLHYHDLSILVVPLVCLVIIAFQRAALDARGGVWLIFTSSLVLMIADAAPEAIRYTAPYLMVGLWMLGWVYLRRNHQAILVRQK